MDSDARAGLTGPQPWAQKRAKALHDELRWASKVFEPILRLRKNDVIVRFVTSGGPIADLLSCQEAVTPIQTAIVGMIPRASDRAHVIEITRDGADGALVARWVGLDVQAFGSDMNRD